MTLYKYFKFYMLFHGAYFLIPSIAENGKAQYNSYKQPTLGLDGVE